MLILRQGLPWLPRLVCNLVCIPGLVSYAPRLQSEQLWPAWLVFHSPSSIPDLNSLRVCHEWLKNNGKENTALFLTDQNEPTDILIHKKLTIIFKSKIEPEVIIVLHKLILHLFVCTPVYTYMHMTHILMCHRACVEVRGQLLVVSSLFSPCGFNNENQVMSLGSETLPSCWP